MTRYRIRVHGAVVTLALAAVSGILATPVAAIDLGAARLKSVAGAPLEIDIALTDVAPGELDSLKPQLPANARSSELASASIELVQGQDAEPVLRVRTTQPVITNEVRFVVVADWGRGRKFREYTVSLKDAPVGAATEATPPPATTTFSTAATATEPTSASPGLKTTRIVRNNETLMSISREWSARTGATLAQTMLGIFQANPQAFGPRGMNELLVGSEIMLPEPATLALNSPASAAGEIGRMLGIWRTADTPGASSAVLPPAAPAAPAATEAPAAAETPASAERPRSAETPASAETPVAAGTPAVPETPEALIARLQSELVAKTVQTATQNTELAALRARLEAAEQAARDKSSGDISVDGWLGQARRIAAFAWWLIPAFLLTSLGLLILLLVQRRRPRSEEKSATEPNAEALSSGSAATAPAGAPTESVSTRTEMTFDLPPIKASRAGEGMPDVLLGESPRPRLVPPAVDEALAEDLEGDPPPVDEAGSKIDLARAFIEMGHHDAAILELQAALRLGDETQRAEALRLLDSLPKS